MQIPTDGAEQALRWLDERARPGDTVVTFIRPRHILAATIPRARYRVIDGLQNPGAIAGADWVVTTLGAELRHGYGADDPDSVFALPYDAALLKHEFRPVHRVVRAFDLEVANVWHRYPQRTPVPPRPQ